MNMLDPIWACTVPVLELAENFIPVLALGNFLPIEASMPDWGNQEELVKSRF
jgi:hypothetical protein